MNAFDSFVPTGPGVSGWFGDVLEGIKPAVTEGLGFKIREKLGAPQPFDTLHAPGPETVFVTQSAPQQTTNSNNDALLYGAVAFLFLMVMDDD